MKVLLLDVLSGNMIIFIIHLCLFCQFGVVFQSSESESCSEHLTADKPSGWTVSHLPLASSQWRSKVDLCIRVDRFCLQMEHSRNMSVYTETHTLLTVLAGNIAFYFFCLTCFQMQIEE